MLSDLAISESIKAVSSADIGRHLACAYCEGRFLLLIDGQAIYMYNLLNVIQGLIRRIWIILDCFLSLIHFCLPKALGGRLVFNPIRESA